MRKRIIIIFAALLILVMALATGLFIAACISEPDNTQLLAVSIVFALTTLGMIIAAIFDFIIGHNEILFEKDNIIFGRKGKVLHTIPKRDVSNLVLTYDANTKELCILSFRIRKKKYYVSVNKCNKRSVESFLEDMQYTKRDNTLGYVVQHLLEIFSVI